MVYFPTKNQNLGKFLMAFEWKMSVYFMTICSNFLAISSILWQFGRVCGDLVYFSPFWYVRIIENLATLLVPILTAR
jgi:hypothetical protein